ncbi:hypothetical protein RvY_08447 [Ramazzottius varieornatus]|uniref:G-protein coupled receptors family 1 profile domain-containing protein n=1 Tax=Ramazzottius varieornatus TaxID=947166 RepID=A0A1D1VAH3_RAMVA|nr:hypothetical protein RvY_08447 [Ramazzottius varieornatus]
MTLPRSSSETSHCSLYPRGTRSWLLPAIITGYDIPIGLILLVYPFICYKTVAAARVRQVNVPRPSGQGAELQ